VRPARGRAEAGPPEGVARDVRAGEPAVKDPFARAPLARMLAESAR
jgi:hypothetical protein